MTQEEALAVLQNLYPWPKRQPDVEAKISAPGWLEEWNRELFARFLGPETRCVLELGTWTGLSARCMLDCAPNASCICIDHFRGSEAHRTDPYFADHCANLFALFCQASWEYRDRLYPIRAETMDGLALVDSLCLCPELVYVDADHRYKYVRRDVETVLDLFPGAIIVGDDYAVEESEDFAVARAVNDVADSRGIMLHVHQGAWYILPEGMEEEA